MIRPSRAKEERIKKIKSNELLAKILCPIMPVIIIKDYQWRQTEKKIIIYVPLKGHPKNVDLFIMDNYVKISFPPFILELFLWENVLEEESECTLTNDEAIFSLQKANVSYDWPSLEMEDISKEEKRDLRKHVLEKAQSVSEKYAKHRSEKRQCLQKEAVKAQINLDTNMLNRIESLRDANRKAAMRDFEEWRSNAEIPILQDISGKVQKNRKEYRPMLKWFKDDSDVVRSWKINEEEETKKETREEKKRDELIVVEESREERIVEKDTQKKLIIENNHRNPELTFEEEPSTEINIEEVLTKEPNVETNLRKESITDMDMQEKIINENFQEKGNVSAFNEKAIPSIRSSDLEESFHCSDDSESDYKATSHRSSMNTLVKEMDQKSLQKFYARMKKQRPDQNLIDKVLKGRYSRMNPVFDMPERAIPLPRKSGTINVSFSERAFPTPARESSHVEEQEWLSKQAEARRKTGFVVEDLRPEERDPQWLKDKGDDFFKAGNYLAAISAYTHGIKISDKMTALYVNRSAAHYALGNYYRCIEDCSMALELMEPKCESNRASRARSYARRGAALCKLSSPQHGIPELDAALKLDPNNESIKCDLYAAKRYFNMEE